MSDQQALFDEEDLSPWLCEWQNMPEYDVQDLAPKFSIIVNFACAQDVLDFSRLFSQTITPTVGRQLQSFWFPEQEIGHMTNKRYRAR